jgi:hypothetical protein
MTGMRGTSNEWTLIKDEWTPAKDGIFAIPSRLSLTLYLFTIDISTNCRNWSILAKTLRQIARRDPLVMICSTGKRQLWDRRTLPIRAVSSFWTFTFLPTILSSLPRFTLPHAFTIATSTRTEVSVWTFSRTSGVQH